MRSAKLLPLIACVALFARASDESDAVAVVQKLFDGMATHSADMIRSTVTADARFYYVRDDTAPASISAEEFVGRIASMKGDLLERFTKPPSVSIHGRMAQVWGEYEFLRDAKFGHCGVDSVSLFKTSDGWRIAAIAYTAETTNCPGH
jgi:Putative lumazine-binding